RGDKHRLELSDRGGVVAGFGEKTAERDPGFGLAFVDSEARTVRRDGLMRIAERSVLIADALQDVCVARFTLLQSDENFARTRFVQGGDASFCGKKQQVHVRDAGMYKRLRVRTCLLRASKRQQRAGDALP